MEDSAEAELAAIRRYLDDEVPFADGADEFTVLQRVQDVVQSMESWSKIAIRRLHEIHRLQGRDCDICPKYLDKQG